MKNIRTTTQKKGTIAGKERSYAEIVEFLNANWDRSHTANTPEIMKALDAAFANVSKGLRTVTVAGTNGKSLTMNFATQLLRQEGLTVGALYAPHILTYNERFLLNGQLISNKDFTELANEVMQAAEVESITLGSHELITMMGLLYFARNNADVVLLEASPTEFDPANICQANIVAVTRITEDTEENTEKALQDILGLVHKNAHVISAEQNKTRLNAIQESITEKGAHWAMPIRKLAQLQYPYEQLHGRSAALAERTCSIFVNEVLDKSTVAVSENSLLTKKKGQRGRPTLEAKRQAELHPKKTLEQYWKETISTLPGRFQLLDKENPMVLLDNATNLDAFENLLLGIRLLHYDKSLKGLTIIIGNNNPLLNVAEFVRALRYFFKKTSGQVIICPVDTIPGERGSTSWNIENITNDIKAMKVKAKSAANFAQAMEMAQKSVDERDGLVVVCGSTSMLNAYWQHKGLKKLP